VTIVAAAIILAFTTMEFFDYRRVTIDTSIVVDKSRGEKLTVRMNITFPRVPCYRACRNSLPCSRFTFFFLPPAPPVLSLDVMDISGETQRDLTHNILKARLDPQGNPVPNAVSAELKNDIDKMNALQEPDFCGSCYGGLEPEGGCCNTCEDVRTAYVNRGWSFSNPDAIEQVCLLFLVRDLTNRAWDSAKMKAGQRNSRNNPTKAATFLAASALIRSLATYIYRLAGLSRPTRATSTN
jgi:hypothetical protein